MTKSLLLALCLAAAGTVSAKSDSTPEWKNPNVNQQNRMARRANFFAYENEAKARAGEMAKSERYLSMEGTWRFNFVKNHQDAPAGFWALNYDDSPCPGCLN